MFLVCNEFLYLCIFRLINLGVIPLHQSYFCTRTPKKVMVRHLLIRNEEEMQELRERLTHQEEVINKLESLTSHLLQRMDEMSRAQQPPLVPTHLISDPVHDDDTDDDDDDDNNTIPK